MPWRGGRGPAGGARVAPCSLTGERRLEQMCAAAFVLTVLLAGAPAAATDWPMYAGGPRRLFFNPAETSITSANVSALRVKWTYPTGAVVTASPAMVNLDLPDEHPTAVAFITSWDRGLYALRVRDGTLLWRFAMADQPGASFPEASSVDVETVDGRPRVFVGGGETLYAVDAVSGSEVWHFDAGTGCVTPLLNPQRPTVHALDADTGAVVWQNTAEPNADASYAPTSGIPGVVFVGKDLAAVLRAYDAGTGALRASVALPSGFTLASAPAVVDGTAILGAGSGERSRDPTDVANILSHSPQPITALCVGGTPDCDPAPNDRCDEGGSAPGDAAALVAVTTAAEAACPCAVSAAGDHPAGYVHCVRSVVATAIHASTLRARCRARAVRATETSTCGRPDAVICCERSAGARCLVVPAASCVSSTRRTRTSCA